MGEKTAVRLLKDFGTLEGVYEHLDEVQGATQNKLAAGKESAFMSYELAKIMTDAPVNLEELPDLEIDQVRILDALNKLEFRSIARKFFSKSKKSKRQPEQGGLDMGDVEVLEKEGRLRLKRFLRR